MNDTSWITVHYHRPLGDHAGWNLWVWNADDLTARAVAASEIDDFGPVFRFRPDPPESRTGLLPRKDNWAGKDPPERFWTPALGPEIWIVSGVTDVATERPDTSPFVVGAWIDAPSTLGAWLSVPLKPEIVEPGLFSIEINTPGEPPAIVHVRPGRSPGASTAGGYLEYELTLGRPLEVTAEDVWRMQLRVAGYRPHGLLPRRVLDGPEFTSDAVLGAVCTEASTHFRVFAPTARRLTVLLHDRPAGGKSERHAMTRAAFGLWELSIPGDLAGRYYTLSAEGFDPRFDPAREILDPYSRCNTAHNGRSLLFRDRTPVAPGPAFPVAEAVICELHVRDFTISPDSGVVEKGKYRGLAEAGARLPGDPGVATGLDHLVEMGVNTVQIQPIQDFENDESSDRYDWGYMPVSFNSPDGWYATNVVGPARVVEAKEMIDALHRLGLRVVMDVVYNHTAEKPPSKIYSFEGLVPGYYYRLRNDGGLWDGSGTGNEFRSEAPMARKFILDSLKYWMTEYRVDGFRFDLMGLIDRETLARAARELRAIDPNVILYGEPWTGGPTPIEVTGKGSQRGLGFGVFNDDFRDAVKGPVFEKKPGYIQKGLEAWRVRRGLGGSIDDFALDPVESVNYVESHDNLTLWDQVVATTEDSGVTRADRTRMDLLAAGLVLLGQGLPFLQSGQEMLRSKGGLHNTYDQPDAVNRIVWSRKKENAAVVRWYRELIAIRRQHPMFRLPTASAVRARLRWLDGDLGLRLPDSVIGFQLQSGGLPDTWGSAVALFHPGESPVTVDLPPGEWYVFVHGEAASSTLPIVPDPVSGSCAVEARSVVLLARA